MCMMIDHCISVIDNIAMSVENEPKGPVTLYRIEITNHKLLVHCCSDMKHQQTWNGYAKC